MSVQLTNGFQLIEDDATKSYNRKFDEIVTKNSITPTTDFTDKHVFHLLFGYGNGYYNCNEEFQPIGPMINDNRKINASFILEDGNKIKFELSNKTRDYIDWVRKRTGTKQTSLGMYDTFAVYMRLLDDGGIIKVNDSWKCEKSNIYCPILTTGDAEYFGIIRPPPIPGVKNEYTPTPAVGADSLQVGKKYYVDTRGITYLYASKDDEVLLWGDNWEDTWKKLPARVCKFIGIFTEIKNVDVPDDAAYKIPRGPFSSGIHYYASFTPERKIELEPPKDEPFDTVKIVPGYKNSWGELKPKQIIVKTDGMSFYPMDTIKDQTMRDPEYQGVVNKLFSKRNIPEDIEGFITDAEYGDPSFAGINAYKKALTVKKRKKAKRGGLRKYTKKRIMRIKRTQRKRNKRTRRTKRR